MQGPVGRERFKLEVQRPCGRERKRSKNGEDTRGGNWGGWHIHGNCGSWKMRREANRGGNGEGRNNERRHWIERA